MAAIRCIVLRADSGTMNILYRNEECVYGKRSEWNLISLCTCRQTRRVQYPSIRTAQHCHRARSFFHGHSPHNQMGSSRWIDEMQDKMEMRYQAPVSACDDEQRRDGASVVLNNHITLHNIIILCIHLVSGFRF